MKVDKSALNKAIKRSGYCKGYIVEQLGISWSTWCSRLKGETAFKVCEVKVLCTLLNLTEEEKNKIFYP